MTLITEVKEGMTVRLDGRLYRILDVVRHTGSGQMHGFVEVKLHDIRFDHIADRHFKMMDRVELVELSKRQMEFIYTDAEGCHFMDPESFEQVSMSREAVGKAVAFMREGTRITVELLGDEPITVQVPRVIEMTVSSTGPGLHEGQDNTLKPAILENGVEILVPQFIEDGDRIRIDTEKVKYIDRVRRP